MAGFVKSDFESQYRTGAETDWGYPNLVNGEERSEVGLNYIRAIYEPVLRTMWQEVLAEAFPIARTDDVLIIGCAYGWGCEIVEELTGANVVGVEVSDYVHAQKSGDDLADIDAAISAAGLDLAGTRAQQIRDKYHTPGPQITATVLQEDLLSEESRGRVADALGAKEPTIIVTEDIVSYMTDGEIDALVKGMDAYTEAVTKAHITRSNSRSTQRYLS